MKTKIISTVVAFALMIAFSSCGTLQEQGHFRYLNKVPFASTDVKTVSQILIDTCKKNNPETVNYFVMQSELPVDTNEDTDSSAQTVTVKPEIRTHQAAPAIAEKVMETAEALKPDLRSHRNACSANAPTSKTGNGNAILSVLLVFCGLVGLAWLLWGWMGAVLVVGILGLPVLLGIIILAISSKEEIKAENENQDTAPVDTESAFIYESSPTGAPVNEQPDSNEVKTKTKKSTPWGLIGICGGVLILTLCFGLGVLLLAFAFGIVAAVIAAGIWLYNNIFTTNN